MTRRLPLYVERALGELQATRTFVATEVEKQFREENAVTCTAGCAHCCHYPVEVTVGEGLLLYRFLASKGRLTTAVRKRIEEHAKLTSFLDPAVWLMSNIACPMLDDKQRCIGYEARPLTCRTQFWSGLAEQCHPHAYDPSNTQMARIRKVAAIFEERLLKRNAMTTTRMPVSRALLLAEKVLSQELDLDRLELELLKEFLAP